MRDVGDFRVIDCQGKSKHYISTPASSQPYFCYRLDNSTSNREDDDNVLIVVRLSIRDKLGFPTVPLSLRVGYYGAK
jgi:hypothetical protein